MDFLLWHDILSIAPKTIIKIKTTIMQKSNLSLLIAAAAAYGAYKYTRMTPEQKSSLKTKGKDFLDKNLGGLNNIFGKKTGTSTNNGF